MTWTHPGRECLASAKAFVAEAANVEELGAPAVDPAPVVARAAVLYAEIAAAPVVWCILPAVVESADGDWQQPISFSVEQEVRFSCSYQRIFLSYAGFLLRIES